MTTSKKKMWGPVIAGAAVATMLVFGFQNCSQKAGFETGTTTALSSLASSTNNLPVSQNAQIDSQQSGSGSVVMQAAAVDLVTPRIVLSDSLDGAPKEAFSPKKVVYGTVYGLGSNPSNIFVCMGVNCPGHDAVARVRTSDSGFVAVGRKTNWKYQATDRTWRFILDYNDMGDLVDKLMVREVIPEGRSTYDKTNPGYYKVTLDLTRVIYVRSSQEDAGIYFIGSRDPRYTDPYYIGNDNVGAFSAEVFYGSNVPSASNVKVAGLGENTQLCVEVAGSGTCAISSNWKDLKATGGMIYVSNYDSVRNTYNVVLHGLPDGNLIIYAKDTQSGKVVSNNWYRSNTNGYCRYKSIANTTSMPCSDPEMMSSQAPACSKNGQVIQGTGTCKAQYKCSCS